VAYQSTGMAYGVAEALALHFHPMSGVAQLLDQQRSKAGLEFQAGAQVTPGAPNSQRGALTAAWRSLPKR